MATHPLVNQACFFQRILLITGDFTCGFQNQPINWGMCRRQKVRFYIQRVNNLLRRLPGFQRVLLQRFPVGGFNVDINVNQQFALRVRPGGKQRFRAISIISGDIRLLIVSAKGKRRHLLKRGIYRKRDPQFYYTARALRRVKFIGLG